MLHLRCLQELWIRRNFKSQLNGFWWVSSGPSGLPYKQNWFWGLRVGLFIHSFITCMHVQIWWKGNFHNYNIRIVLAEVYSKKQCMARKALCRFIKAVYLHKIFCPTKSDIIPIIPIKKKQIIYFSSSFIMAISSTLLLYSAKL